MVYYGYIFFSILSPIYPGFSAVMIFFLVVHETIVARLAARVRAEAEEPPPRPLKKPLLRLVHGVAEKSEKTPNFRGPPHEVLAVAETAGTKTINHAYRFWIKQFHPDKVKGALEQARAQVQARQLHEARQKLLYRRKMRMSA